MKIQNITQIKALLNTVPAPMMAVDASTRLICANAKAEALFGTGLVDRPFVTVVRHPEVVDAIDRVLRHGSRAASLKEQAQPDAQAQVLTLRASLLADGRDIFAEVTVSPMPAIFGKGAMIAIMDNSLAEEAEQTRRDFVANVSHELRTPLTAMIGFIETLRGPARNDAPARDRFLDIMEREAQRMNRLVHDLLSLSRVQSEERRRPSGEVDLPGILQTVLATLQRSAFEAGVRFETKGLNQQLRLPGDSDQLIQVFQNLIENALKYGASGKQVFIGLSRVDYEPVLRGPGWSVEIRDFGQGIEELHLPRLTERFYRVDAHRSRAQGGTGLGLAIVKHVVNRHRGRLRVTSKVGEGSSFIVVLPETLQRA